MKHPSEPMLNVPRVVAATLAVLVLVHAVRMFGAVEAADLEFLFTFAFIPARYDPNLLSAARFRAAGAPTSGRSSPTR